MAQKRKIVLISDHPLVPSGVGTQARYMIEGLLKTGKYQFICLGGAIQHPDNRPQKVEGYGDDWLIIPVQGYGDKNIIRQVLMVERPDALVFITDPRFYYWLWEIEDEIRQICPMVYWHVWDNDPTPRFNKVLYESTDYVASISLKTQGLLQDLGYDRCEYLPHGLDHNVFRPLPEEEVQKFKRDHYGPHADKKFILFWNNRNARRKVTGDIVAVFAKFMERVGRQNVSLMMHTAAKDPEGQDIIAVAREFGCESELILSEQRVNAEDMNKYYNVADCTINLASNEGFGLGTLESLFAGTPIVAHFTGGLQFQLGDWWQDKDGKLSVDITDQDRMTAYAKKAFRAGNHRWWGVPVFPASRSCTGSQQIPFIYDDRVAHEDAVRGLIQLYEQGRTVRKNVGLMAREWAVKNFSLSDMISRWDDLLEREIARYNGFQGIRGLRTAVL
jgi:glycosyltransferase involved in cell wall biosynthesis